ncbi:MAG: hybrid sensor histidine kinase/response regulator [Proteobacteria bacterium]|nr:hybrid sensor histidine kinase/response regulator [Pseudomonadota bacterium]
MKLKNKILIVDDDVINLEMIQEFLREEYHTKTAESGELAMIALESFFPDIILLDINMPGIDGFEVCRQVRNDSRHCFTKIILVSAQEGVNERLTGYSVGADDYITKPFINLELEAKIRVFLRLKRAEEVDQIKSDLLKLFSHETRTPLNGILGISSLLKDDDSLSEDQVSMISVIDACGNQLLDLVKKTGLLCDLKNGLILSRTNEVLVDHIGDILTTLQEDLDAKQIQIKTSIPEQRSAFSADWKLLIEVLHYIIDNAIKFSHKKGVIEINVKNNETDLIVNINDSGVGISPEWKDKIFNEFAIADVNHHQKGQGLSLAIAKHVVELHEGSINIQSDLGEGTSVEIILPVLK